MRSSSPASEARASTASRRRRTSSAAERRPTRWKRPLRDTSRPTIVVRSRERGRTSAERSTRSCDDRGSHCAARADAWMHVDGAFGLWAAASPELRHLNVGFPSSRGLVGARRTQVAERPVRQRPRVRRTRGRPPRCDAPRRRVLVANEGARDRGLDRRSSPGYSTRVRRRWREQALARPLGCRRSRGAIVRAGEPVRRPRSPSSPAASPERRRAQPGPLPLRTGRPRRIVDARIGADERRGMGERDDPGKVADRDTLSRSRTGGPRETDVERSVDAFEAALIAA